MTKVFLDANVLVSVLNKEYPVFSYSSRILSLAQNPKFEIYTSPLCLAIAFYFAEKKSGTLRAKEKIERLTQYIKIAENSAAGVRHTIHNKKINDFEDGLEYYAALEQGCKTIITEDLEDFYFSEVEVLSCTAFFNQYMRKGC